MDPIPGKITKVTPGNDATLLEVTMDGRRPLGWKVPNLTFARLGYSVGSPVRLTIDACGNLQEVRPPLRSSEVRPFRI